MLPLDKIRQAAAKKFAETDVTFLQYGVVSGYEVFRKSLAAFLAKHYKRGEVPPVLGIPARAKRGRCGAGARVGRGAGTVAMTGL